MLKIKPRRTFGHRHEPVVNASLSNLAIEKLIFLPMVSIYF